MVSRVEDEVGKRGETVIYVGFHCGVMDPQLCETHLHHPESCIDSIVPFPQALSVFLTLRCFQVVFLPCCCSVAKSHLALRDPLDCNTPGSPVLHWGFMSMESVMPSTHLILCHPLLLLPLTSPSIRVFSNESALRIKWPKYWSFSFSNSEYSGLISFRIDWFDLVVQGTLKSLLITSY